MALVLNNPSANARDTSPIPGSGRSPAEGNGNPLWYSHLENAMDREAWWAIVSEVTKSWIQPKWLSTQHIHMWLYNWGTMRNLGVDSNELRLFPRSLSLERKGRRIPGRGNSLCQGLALRELEGGDLRQWVKTRHWMWVFVLRAITRAKSSCAMQSGLKWWKGKWGRSWGLRSSSGHSVTPTLLHYGL